MSTILETTRGNLSISTDPSRLDLDAIYEMLSRAYWSRGRSREIMALSMQNSLVFGVYDGTRQVGLARVVSDYSTFAWLCDVFIHEDYRGKGIGKWLMETVVEHPDLFRLRRFLLVTSDAHGLYKKYGFQVLKEPEKWMEKLNG